MPQQEKKKQQQPEQIPETQNASLREVAPKKRVRGLLAWQYAKELWGDHRFWKQLTVFKGGLGIIATGALLVPTLISMPFMLAASTVALTGVLVAAAVFSVGYGAYGLFKTCKNTKLKIKKKFNQNSTPENEKVVQKEAQQDIALSKTRLALQDMLLKKWPVKQIAASRPIKAIGRTRVWKKFSGFMKESDNLLNALTVKSSAASIVIFGSILLTAQVAVMPFFIPIAIVAYSVASMGLGGYMFYKGGKGVVTSLREKRRERKKEAAQKKQLKAMQTIEQPKKKKKKEAKELHPEFNSAKKQTPDAKRPANENTPTRAVKGKKAARKP